MGDIFLKLLNMGLAASWLIAAVILFRLAARKTPRWIVCLLWGFVAIRLLGPVFLESSFSVVPSEEVISESILSESCRRLNIQTGVGPLDTRMNAYLEDIYHEETSAAYDDGNRFLSKLGVIWLCGLSGMLFYGAVVSLRLRRRLKEAVLLRDRIYLCDRVQVPFVSGVFRPRIYLPSGMEEADMEYAIAHEKAHLRRGDHIWKVLAFCLLAVYWFHPLCWAAFILFGRDMELACDEKVVKYFSMSEKKAYSEALLACSLGKRMAIVYPVSFGEVGVKKRVRSILNNRKPGFWAVSLSILACIVIGVCFLTKLPQESQATARISDTDSMQTRRQKTEIELTQLLRDYDKENIDAAAVALQNFGQEDAYANIYIAGRDNLFNAEEQDRITAYVSEYLDLDADRIHLIFENK